jgi:gluconolactonase
MRRERAPLRDGFPYLELGQAGMDWTFELVAGPYDGLVDAPVWDGEGLLFSLVEAGRILRYVPGTGEVAEVRAYASRIRAMAFDADGNLYGCQSGSRRIVRFNRDGSATPMVAQLDGKFHNYPDDLAIDREGRIWFSDPIDPIVIGGAAYPNLDHASVLRLDRPVGGISPMRRMTFDTTAPRGVCISPDGQTLYLAENNPQPDGNRELRAYPIRADGTLGAYAVVYRFATGPGVDGLCLDSRGNLLACAGEPATGADAVITVIAPDGTGLKTHPVPGARATNCALGDAGLTSLYVTTADGHLYRVANTGLQGLAA